MNVFARIVGVLTSPRDTFRSVAAHPKVLGVFVITTLVIAGFSTLPVLSEEGKQAALDQQVSQREAFTGRPVTDQEYEGIRRGMAFAPAFTIGFIVVFAPIMLLVMSGILLAVFNAVLGGAASFKQVMAVVAHAGVVSALSAVFTGPLNYVRGAVGSATNLGVLVPMLDDNSFVKRLLGAIDLFIIWWLLVLAIGLAVLYRRRTQPIAIGLYAVYAVIALGIAVVMSR
jgi:hypothetical protein